MDAILALDVLDPGVCDLDLPAPADAPAGEASGAGAGGAALPGGVPDPVHGWSHADQLAFLGALGRTGVVEHAAAAAGKSSRAAYQFRLKPAAAHFRRNWEAAMEAMYANLLQLALTRLVEGTPTPIVRGGEVVGTKMVHDNRLLIFLLTQLKPAAGAMAALPPGVAPPAAVPTAEPGAVPGAAAVPVSTVARPMADPLDRLHAGLDALDAAIATGAPLADPDGTDADGMSPEQRTVAARIETLIRARLRIDDFAEQERERAACEAAGGAWVPRAFKPLPPPRWFVPPVEDISDAERYHRLMRRLAALKLATTPEERMAAARLP